MIYAPNIVLTSCGMEGDGVRAREKASVLMQRLSCPTKTVLSNKINRNIIVQSFKDSPRKPLGRRPNCLNGFLGLSLNERTILFLLNLFDKTVSVGSDKTVFALRRSP